MVEFKDERPQEDAAKPLPTRHFAPIFNHFVFPVFGVSMLKVTYTDDGLYLEYCPEPLDLLLSDRVCTYARARRPVNVQPMNASILLPASVLDHHNLLHLQQLDITSCDRDWLEITLSGLWITEDLDCEEGIFMTELDARLEQRLLKLWQWSQQFCHQGAIA